MAEGAPLELDAGWNLVSYLPRVSLSITQALDSIADQYTAVLGFDQGALSYYPDIDPIFNTLTTLDPLHGYWIKMNEAGTLQYPVSGNRLSVDSDRSSLNTDHRSPITDHLSITPTHAWMNFYGPAHVPDGTPLPEGTTVEAVDPEGIVCGAAMVTHAGQYGLLACYGDDPTTAEDEGAQPGDTVRLVVDGKVLGIGTWTAHGGRQWAPLGPVPLGAVHLPLVRR